MKECPNCKREFEPNRWWQEFCCTPCRQEFHRARYRAQRIELRQVVNGVMQDKVTDEQKQKIVGPLVLAEQTKQEQREHRRRINRHLATAKERETQREKASEVLARMLTKRKMVRRI
jgi:hypothetical protein